MYWILLIFLVRKEDSNKRTNHLKLRWFLGIVIWRAPGYAPTYGCLWVSVASHGDSPDN
jgi:hypothetical protein